MSAKCTFVLPPLPQAYAQQNTSFFFGGDPQYFKDDCQRMHILPENSSEEIWTASSNPQGTCCTVAFVSVCSHFVDFHRFNMNSGFTPRQFPLLCLPAELIRNVTRICPKADLKSLRLSCQLLEVFASEFLHETVHLDMLPESFDRLQAIPDNAKFSSNIRTIFSSPLLFFDLDSPQSFKDECFRELADEASDLSESGVSNGLQMSDHEWLNHYKDYDSFRQLHRALVKGAKLRTFFSRVFAKLPRLDSLVMVELGCTYPCSNVVNHSSLMRKVMQMTLLGPTRQIFGLPPQYFVFILSAASDANVNLKHAWFDPIPGVFLRSIS